MTKITKNKMKVHCKRLANGALHKTNKFVSKRIKLSKNEEVTSSSDDDHWPMLPPTSSSSSSVSELSPIEEEKSSSVSTLSSSIESKYDSFLSSSITSISSISSRGSYKVQDLKGCDNNQEHVNVNQTENEMEPGTSKMANQDSTTINMAPNDEESIHENVASSSKIHKRNHSIVVSSSKCTTIIP
jgi:hypothetical protein